MKQIANLSNTIASLCVVLVLFLESPRGQAATAGPPTKMAYQGFLTDQNGAPLGATSPVNETVIFRIYNNATASATANLKWAEQQTVTIDNGHFSVLLGEGSANGSEPRSADLNTVFAGAEASDRFMQLTVGGNIILPRIQYFPAPYATLALNARAVVDPNGATLITANVGAVGINKTAPTTALDVGGTITGTGLAITGAATVSGAVTGASFTGGGAGLTGLNASQLTTGTLPDARLSGIYPNAVNLNNAGNSLSGHGANLTALNANNLASGTVADARLSATVTAGVALANAATASNEGLAIVRRLSSGQISVGNVNAHGNVTVDNVLTASSVTTTGNNGVNGILPPMVYTVGNKNSTFQNEITIPAAIVEQYLGGIRGGRLRVNMLQNSTDIVKTVEFEIILEDVVGGNNKLVGRRIGLRTGDNNTEFNLLQGVSVSLGNAFGWGDLRWAPTPGATDYPLIFSASAGYSATIILYNF